MIVRDQWKPSVSKKRYASTGKDYDPRSAHGLYDPSEARWRLAGMVEQKFGSGGATLEEIYEELLGPKGLSSYDARSIVKGAVEEGYLEGVK